MIPPELTSIEIIGLAIVQEVEAFKRYRMLENQMANPLVKEKFKSLAREERAHRDFLYKMLQRYTGESKPSLPHQPPRVTSDIDSTLTVPRLIEFAIQKEREAAAFYKEAAARAADPSGRRSLEYLALFEEGHARSLQVEYEAVAKYPQWFDFKGPDIMLVGP